MKDKQAKITKKTHTKVCTERQTYRKIKRKSHRQYFEIIRPR